MAKKNYTEWEDDLDYSPEDSVEKLKKPWMKDKKFVLIRTLDELCDFVKKAQETKVVALDFETTGLNTTIYPRIKWDENQYAVKDENGNLIYEKDENGNIVYEPFDKVVGICLAADETTGYYVPIRHYEDSSESYNLNHDEVFRILNILVDDPEVKFIMHNAKFDLEVYYGATYHDPELHRSFDDIDKFEDTMLIAYLWETDLTSYGLKWLSKTLLGYEMIEIDELFPDKRSKKDVKFEQLHPLEAYLYGGSDALITLSLYNHLIKLLKLDKVEQPLINKIEKKVTQVLRRMGRNKVTIDVDYFSRVQAYVAKRITEIRKEICELADRHFDPDREMTYKWIDSTQQLGKVLFEDLGIEGGTKTEKSGQWSTNDEDLERLKSSHPIIELLRRYRKFTTLKVRYVDPFVKYVDYENKAKFQFQQTVVTGRLKSSGGDWKAGHYAGVNVQSIPACYNAISFKAKRITKRPFIEGFEADLARKLSSEDENIRTAAKREIERLSENGTIHLDNLPKNQELEKQYVKFFTADKYEKKRPHAAITEEDLKKSYLYKWLDRTYCARKTCEGCPLKQHCEYEMEFVDLNKDEMNIRKGFIAADDFVLVACVAEDSLINTNRGLIPIQNVKIGDKVSTEKGFKRVTQISNNGRKDVITIQTRKGYELDVTKEHLIRVVNESGEFDWKEAGRLQENDWIVQVSNNLPQKKKVKLPKLEKLHWNCKNIDVPQYLDINLAEFLGLLMADGCIHQSHLKPFGSIGVSFGKDVEELLPRLNKFSVPNFGVEFKHKEKGDVFAWSKPLARWLEKITKKSSKKSKDYKVPQLILESSEEHICAFLRGYFDADGSIGNRYNDGISVSTSSEQMSKDIQNLLLGIGIQSKRKYKKQKTNLGKFDIYEITITGSHAIKLFNEKIQFITQRKNSRLQNNMEKRKGKDLSLRIPYTLARKTVLKQYGSKENLTFCSNGRNKKYVSRKGLEKIRKANQNVNHNLLSKLLDEGLVFDQIKSITSNGVKNVYDLTVPEIRQFVANGIVVHNCDYSGVELRVAANISQEKSWIDQFVKQKERALEIMHKINKGYQFKDHIVRSVKGAEVPVKVGDQLTKQEWKELEKLFGNKIKVEGELDNPYGDLHSLNARNIFGEAFTKDDRQVAKVFGFQTLYGGSGRGIARNLRNEGVKITDEDGDQYQKKFFSGTPFLKKWIEKQHRMGEKKLRVMTPFGRIRKLPQCAGKIWNKVKCIIEDAEDQLQARKLKSFGKRSAVNSPVQGGAADVIKIAMGKVDNLIEKMGWEEDCRLLLTVHDELVFEIRKSRLHEIMPPLVHSMVNITDKWEAPLKVDAEVGNSWFVEYEYGDQEEDYLLLKMTDFEKEEVLIRKKDIIFWKNGTAETSKKNEEVKNIIKEVKEKPVEEEIKEKPVEEEIVTEEAPVQKVSILEEKLEDASGTSEIFLENYRKLDCYPLVIRKPLLREKAMIIRKAIESAQGDTPLIVLTDESLTLISKEHGIHIDPEKFETILRYEQLI